jgi:protein-tyrosine phosphatase
MRQGLSQGKRIRVLFICLGNICRSPTAEGVFRRYVSEARLEEHIEIDSAGTGDYHVGEPPDERARAAALQRGYDIGGLRARQVRASDFEEFDYVLAMDEQNRRMLERLSPPDYVHKVRLFTEFSSRGAVPVPDPYFGGARGFEHVLDIIEDAAAGLLRELRCILER